MKRLFVGVSNTICLILRKKYVKRLFRSPPGFKLQSACQRLRYVPKAVEVTSKAVFLLGRKLYLTHRLCTTLDYCDSDITFLLIL